VAHVLKVLELANAQATNDWLIDNIIRYLKSPVRIPLVNIKMNKGLLLAIGLGVLIG